MHRRTFLQAGAASLSFAASSLPTFDNSTLLGTRPYRPLGTVPIPGAREAVVSGRTAFVATGDGFVAVDVAAPESSEVVARVTDLGADREDGPLRDVWDLTVDEERLVVAGPAVTDLDALHGFALFDVSDPSAPRRIAFQETDRAIHNCAIADGHVYVPRTDTAHERLLVFDVTGESPEQVGAWSIVDHDDEFETIFHGLYQLHDLHVQDGLAYLAHWDAGVFVLDVSDPSAPRYVTDFGGRPQSTLQEATNRGSEGVTMEGLQPPGNVHAVDTSDDGDLLAVGKESWDVDPADDRGGASGIDLYDVSDPVAPRNLATIAPPPSPDQTREGPFTTAHNFELTGGRLYSSWYHGGVMVHDVSEPATPRQRVWWARPEAASFWTAQLVARNEVFVASNSGVEARGQDGSLYVFPDRADADANPSTVPVRTVTPTATPTVSPSPAPTDTETRTPTQPTRPTDATSQTPVEIPGFGLVSAGMGLGLAAWWRSRRS